MSKAAVVAGGAAALLATATPLFAQGKEFKDVPPEHWAAQAVKLLGDRGIVIGYPEPPDTYGGTRAMTRYEFAMALSRLLPMITQEINDRMKGVDLSNYVSKDMLNDYAKKSDLMGYVTTDALNTALQGYETKADADTRFGAVDTRLNQLRSDIDRVTARMNTFQDELTALGVDVQALKKSVAILDARVSELEKLSIYGTGTVAWKNSQQFNSIARGQVNAGVDRDGALLDNGTFTNPVAPGAPVAAGTGKRGFFNNASMLYDTQIGIQYSPDRKLRAVAEFILGNYYGAWNEQQAFSAAFGGGPGAPGGLPGGVAAGTAAPGTTGLLSNRSASSLGLQTYLAYVATPVSLPIVSSALQGTAISAGRIPTKLTRYTWWAVDPDTSIDVPREDSGEIPLTGAALSGTAGNFNVSLFAGYNPTDGTGPWQINPALDMSRAGTIGFGHYVRPGGSQTGGLTYPNTKRTHLDANYYQIPTLNNVGGLRLAIPHIAFNYVVGTGSDWQNPAFQIGTTAGTAVPVYNRLGQVWSFDFNSTLPVKRVAPFAPDFGLVGEVAGSKTNNSGAFGVQSRGAFVPAGPPVGAPTNVSSTVGNAVDYKLTAKIGSWNWFLGGKSISPGFDAPGYWGQMGSWVNPWNIVSDSPIYVKTGKGFNRWEVPLIPTDIGVGIPLNNVPLLGDVAFSLHDGVSHMHSAVGGGAGFNMTPVSPAGPIATVSNPRYFKVTHAAAGLAFGAGQKSNYKIGLSAESVLRDYPAGGKLGTDLTFMWSALKSLVNIRGGAGAKQPGPLGAAAGFPLVTGTAGVQQSDENYYRISVGKNLISDGSAYAKLTLSRVVYNDRTPTANGGGSYRGALGTMQVTYKF